ncbi:MAG: DUF2815 family protein [Chloroflexi bacterium]|nr:DUF2815 family protein [Chloroflexota bacterium]
MTINVATKRDGVKVWTPSFVGAFANLFKAKAIPGTDQESQYSIMMLFPKGADMKILEEAKIAAAKEKWGDGARKIVESPKFRDPIKDQGSLVNKSGDLYGGMVKGAPCVQASCKESFGRPGIVNLEGQDILDVGDVYSGAWYRATVRAYGWEHPVGGQGVSFGLENVQKLEDGERLGGGRTKANEDFEAIDAPESSACDDTSTDMWR